MKKYIIGVDGGNTKTDYLLFDNEGNFIDGKRCGTCSHESPKVNGFKNACNIIYEELSDLVKRNNLALNDIEVGVFGLAGVDAPFQKAAMDEGIARLGFINQVVVNDGFLGIKAASSTGSGVCSINGTGTVNVGIDDNGNWLQVGGIGYEAGDEAGGSYLARQAIRIAYDEVYRFGKPSQVTKDVFKMFEIDDKKELTNAILSKTRDSTFLIKSLFNNANNGDEEAIRVLRLAGFNMAKSISGIISNLNFKDNVQVILAGSVWAKATNFEMLNCFKETIYDLTKKNCDYIVLKEPPALGAILWGIEIANHELPSEALKNKVLDGIINYQKGVE